MAAPVNKPYVSVGAEVSAHAAINSQPVSDVPKTNSPLTQQEIDQMLSLVNQRRAQAGKKPLQINGMLMNSAQAHSNYQLSINTMSHNDPRGDLCQRGYAAGLTKGEWNCPRENVAIGTGQTIPQLMQLWFNSKPHLDNILSEELYIGMGKAGDFYTHHFASPLIELNAHVAAGIQVGGQH
ncbi:hypothetical protein H4219_003532 [Mycoemilia scoparia]|uniref:SCP domain-containing protein n=1 Tax=Mycoemilia scoparia TaxID=417184 RepID=A0A9W8DP46_9FUNG|nr:hypothetical protein H4219_003532 [Mycoemilia scoparia]